MSNSNSFKETQSIIERTLLVKIHNSCTANAYASYITYDTKEQVKRTNILSDVKAEFLESTETVWNNKFSDFGEISQQKESSIMYIVGDAGTGKNAAILSAAKSISDALGMNLVTGYDRGTLDRPYNEIVRDLPILTEPLHKQSQYMFGGDGSEGGHFVKKIIDESIEYMGNAICSINLSDKPSQKPEYEGSLYSMATDGFVLTGAGEVNTSAVLSVATESVASNVNGDYLVDGNEIVTIKQTSDELLSFIQEKDDSHGVDAFIASQEAVGIDVLSNFSARSLVSLHSFLSSGERLDDNLTILLNLTQDNKGSVVSFFNDVYKPARKAVDSLAMTGEIVFETRDKIASENKEYAYSFAAELINLATNGENTIVSDNKLNQRYVSFIAKGISALNEGEGEGNSNIVAFALDKLETRLSAISGDISREDIAASLAREGLSHSAPIMDKS